MVKEILMWSWIVISPETAILGWAKSGRHFLTTLLIAEFLSCFSVLLTYEVFSGIFWIFKHLIPKRQKQRKGKIRKITQQFRVIYNILKRKLSKKIAKTLKDNELLFQHFLLFFFNIIPVPLFTQATIFAVKVGKIKNGVYSILLGNFCKIFALTVFSYLYL